MSEIVTKREMGSFSAAMHVFLCVKEREEYACQCVWGFDKHRGGLCMCLCVSSSARAVSLILHAHREWRMTGEYTAGGGHVMLIAIFAPEIFIYIFFVGENKAKEEKMINKRCNLLQGTGSHWRMRA